MVLRVLVKDGDKVKAGQVLVELDPASSEEQRTALLLQSLSKGELLTLIPRGLEANLSIKTELQAQLTSECQDIRAKLAKLAKLSAEASRSQAEIATVQQTIAKLEATMPMAQSREADFKRLVGEGFISNSATQVLQFRAGVSAANVVARRTGSDLVLTMTGTIDSVVVQYFFYGDNTSNVYNPLRPVHFADGTTWSAQELGRQAMLGTATNDL